jgi:hypothetical protein
MKGWVRTIRWIISKQRAICDDVLAAAAKMFAFNAFGAARNLWTARRSAGFVAGERRREQ